VDEAGGEGHMQDAEEDRWKHLFGGDEEESMRGKNEERGFGNPFE